MKDDVVRFKAVGDIAGMDILDKIRQMPGIPLRALSDIMN